MRLTAISVCTRIVVDGRGRPRSGPGRLAVAEARDAITPCKCRHGGATSASRVRGAHPLFLHEVLRHLVLVPGFERVQYRMTCDTQSSLRMWCTQRSDRKEEGRYKTNARRRRITKRLIDSWGGGQQRSWGDPLRKITRGTFMKKL